jgi:hypothetical protein
MQDQMSSDQPLRFMMMPRKAMEDELNNNAKELTDDINSLNKKVNTLSLRREIR